MIYMLSNPGSGPVDGTCTVADAFTNMEAFVRDMVEVKTVALPPPAVVVKRLDDGDEDGRVGFLLTRGALSCRVDMPGRPLREVRDQDGRLPQIPPRLYADGDSYYWCLATAVVADRLFDWDGTIEKESEAAKNRADAEILARPGCPTCGALRDVRDISYETYLPAKQDDDYASTRSTYKRHPAVHEVRCWVCRPSITTREGRYGTTLTITRRPRGAAEGEMCRKFVNHIPVNSFNSWPNYCRLPNRHEEACEGDYVFTEARDALKRSWP